MHCKRIKLFYPIIEPFVWTYLSSIFWEVYTVLSEDSTCDLLWVNELIIQKKNICNILWINLNLKIIKSTMK